MALRIKYFIKGLSVKQIVFSLITILSLAIYLVLMVWSNYQVKQLFDQQAAVRWDEEGGSAQVSCFFAENTEVDEFMLMSFERQLEQSLLEVLPAEEVSQENGKRLFIDAYSSLGTITVASEKGKIEGVSAVGIGGDFFLFHPLQLVSGEYFSGNDLMQDSVILDEEAAWQLFGSNDIAGKSVMIGNVPHYISGVIRRQEGRFAESAGLDKTVVYVSDETLTAYGTSEGISTYEVVASDPVKGFVYNCIKEKLGIEENKMIVVENSSRYFMESLIPIILDFGTRSMQNAAVKFPYWENIARGWEDVMALVLVFKFLFLLIPAVIIVAFLIKQWKNRKLTLKDVGNFIIETRDKIFQKAQGEKNKWQHF